MSVPQYFDAAKYGENAQAMNDLATQKMQEMYGTAEGSMSNRDLRRFNRWMKKEGVDQIKDQMLGVQSPAPTETPDMFSSKEEFLRQNFGTNASRRERRQVNRSWGLLSALHNAFQQQLGNAKAQIQALVDLQNADQQQVQQQQDQQQQLGQQQGLQQTSTWKPVDAQGIEQGTTSYTVREGNTLGQIASAYNKTNKANITWQLIAEQLGLGNKPENLRIGSVIDFSQLVAPSARKGGSIKRHQQGGQVSPEQQELQFALMGYIVATKKQPKDENEIQMIAQQLVQLKQQDPLQYSQLVQLGQQAQAQKAEKGAKLNYIKTLKGQCPDGEELVYFKKGGMFCSECQKKEKGGEVKQPKKANAIEEFKKGRKSKKC